MTKVFTESLPSYSYEIIFVDDGSSDDTFKHIQAICEKDKGVKAIKFLNNVGAHTAIRAGLEHSTGEMAVFLACDMQDPPDVIPSLIAAMQEPYDIVLAIRKKRKDSLKDKIFSRLFFSLMKSLISAKLPSEGSSMYLMNERVIKSLRKLQEKNLTLEGMFVLMNYKHTEVTYERKAREIGESKWTFSKKIAIMIDFFVAYSYSPIRYVTFVGITMSLIGFLWTIYVIFRTILVGDMSPGWPALVSILIIGFGVTNISLGIIAEYLWRTLDEARNRQIGRAHV